jgi:hypothetical protein
VGLIEVVKKSEGDFVSRALGCKTLCGFEVEARWLGPTTVTILARHPYGQWHGVTVFDCDGERGASENGAPMHHADVAFRLKKLMLAQARSA